MSGVGRARSNAQTKMEMFLHLATLTCITLIFNEIRRTHFKRLKRSTFKKRSVQKYSNVCHFENFAVRTVELVGFVVPSEILVTRRIFQQDAYHRRKHESRIRTSTALIPREINMRELKQNSQHFS